MTKKYIEAGAIWDFISSAKKILLVLHKSPDPDSIGSNLAIFNVLARINRKPQIISYDKPDQNLDFLTGFGEIAIEDIAHINLSSFDLLICLDTANPQMLTRSENFKFPEGLEVINIDHHQTNPLYGGINLIDEKIGSTSEIIYSLLNSWGKEIEPFVANCLLAGIVGDTGCFRYHNGVTSQTLKIGGDLLEKGASLYKVVQAIYQTVPMDTLKYWSKVLEKFEVRTSGKFSYCFCFLTPADVSRWPKSVRVGAVSMFFQSVDGTDFGIVAEIDETGIVSGGLRSRTEVDVALIAQALGGGGHKAAAGFSFKLDSANTDDAKKRILDTIDTVLNNEK